MKSTLAKKKRKLSAPPPSAKAPATAQLVTEPQAMEGAHPSAADTAEPPAKKAISISTGRLPLIKNLYYIIIGNSCNANTVYC